MTSSYITRTAMIEDLTEADVERVFNLHPVELRAWVYAHIESHYKVYGPEMLTALHQLHFGPITTEEEI